MSDNGDALTSRAAVSGGWVNKDNEATEWYRRFRPRKLRNVIGQPEAVAAIEAALAADEFPHVTLLHGPSGVGKTTLARIIASRLECGSGDWFEINCACLDEPMRTMQAVERGTKLAARNGDCRVWYLDEVQSLSRAGFAQQALLKVLEDTPAHCYFLLATTDPSKINKAVLTRCRKISLKGLTAEELKETLEYVARRAKFELDTKVCDRIVECSDGSAREAIQHLQRVSTLTDDDARLAALQPPEAQRVAMDLVRLLVWDRKPSWEKIRAVLADLKEEPERVRHAIMTCARKELLNPKGQFDRAYRMLEACKDQWFDCAEAKLALAMYEVFRG